MTAVYKRDLRAFYTTPIGYVFSGILILTMNLCFYYMNVEQGSGDVKPIFFLLLIGLAFLAPILTMRLISEEKKLKTDQLLFTVPIRVTDIVVGKYLAALSVFVISMLGTFLIPVILAVYNAAEPWGIFGNYIAIFAAASSFIAIGLFISSLTENQLISALLTWSVLIGLYLVDMLAATIELGFVKVVVEWFSVYQRYMSFSYGLFDFGDIIYYISVSAVFVFLTVRVLDKKRYA